MRHRENEGFSAATLEEFKSEGGALLKTRIDGIVETCARKLVIGLFGHDQR